MWFEPDVVSQRLVHTAFLWAVSLACLFMLPHPADAQTLTLGVEGGVNFTEVADYSDRSGGRTGFVAGGFLGIELSRVWVLQPEVLYSQKGTSTESLALDLAYLEIPVLVKVLIPAGSNTVRPVVYAGPTFAFQISCSEKWNIDIGFPTSDECTRELSKADFGIAFGGGIEAALGSGVLTLGLRYTFGIGSLHSQTLIADDFENNRSWEIDESLKNRAFSILLGYGLHL